MKSYLVGGAVRDQLLGLPITERDWVVLGETPDSMLSQGFRQVGKDFPVFLHPKSQEEYALARTERKTAPGYTGFILHATPEVTLEEDLLRRDLTINAIAMAPDGQLIDPFGGQQDLNNRVFRHISPAFSEDPVRILRIARFAARFKHLGFTIAKETQALMADMVKSGEVDALVPERIWAELFKALKEPSPAAFFHTLRACNALERIIPEINALFGVPQPEKYHPEIDTGIHSLLCIDQATILSNTPEIRFAALTHDLGKALSPKENWPSHHGHEKNGLPILQSLCERLRVPNTFKKLALHVMEYHTHCHKAFELKPSTLVDLLTHLGAFKPNSNLPAFVLACEADAKGRTGLEHIPYLQANFLLQIATVASSIDTSGILSSSLKGADISIAIRNLRIKAVTEVINHYKPM